MTTSSSSVTKGVHHVGLSVSDLQGAAAFFTDVLGFERVGERPAYPAILVSDGHNMLSLWQVSASEPGGRFDRRRNEGLHHLALRVASAEALDEVYRRVSESAAVIEFSPEPRHDGKAVHMMCLIPGGPRLELIAEL